MHDWAEQHVFRNVCPHRFMSMRQTIDGLNPYLSRLIGAATARNTAGRGQERVVVSLAPIEGPAARIYPAERIDRSRSDDIIAIFNPGDGQIEGLFIGPEISRWRVAALSGIALERLAIRPQRFCVFGTGGQAATHLFAIEAVAQAAHVTIFGRSVQSAREFCSMMSKKVALRLEPGTRGSNALSHAEVIITATSGETPLLDVENCPKHCLIVHVGSKAASGSEVCASLYRDADLIATDFPQQLAVRFDHTVLSAAGRSLDEVTPLSQCVGQARSGRAIYMSLGLAGAEAVIARQLLGKLPRSMTRT